MKKDGTCAVRNKQGVCIRTDIEDYVTSDSLPVNSIAMANRLIEVLKENETNCIESAKDDHRVERLLWMLNVQFYGVHEVNLDDVWVDINTDEGEAEIKWTT